MFLNNKKGFPVGIALWLVGSGYFLMGNGFRLVGSKRFRFGNDKKIRENKPISREKDLFPGKMGLFSGNLTFCRSAIIKFLLATDHFPGKLVLFSGKQDYFPEKWVYSPGYLLFSRKCDAFFRETRLFPGRMI